MATGNATSPGLSAPPVGPNGRIGGGLAGLRIFRDSRFLEHAALALLLAVTAFFYAWHLDQNGWANPYYAAAAQSGAANWTSWFYGSADAGNLVTIDKTPLSVWIIGLSVRLFGLSSWSILLPQVLMGVATTWLIYKIVYLHSSATTALFGAAIYAATPVVVLMSRFNNPEPLMGLLVAAAAYFTIKAIRDDRWRWFLLAGAALGFAFMAKQVQALFVVPSLVVGFLAMGSGSLRRKVARLLAAMGMLIATGGWWILVVELVPKTERPYVGGSASNSAVELTTGYNGLARFVQFTNQDGTVAAAEAQSLLDTFHAGLARLFNADFAQEAGWLIVPALCCAVVLLALKNPAAPQRPSATALVASVWVITVAGVLCLAGTMVHSYYTFSLAAPMAIVLSLGFEKLWRDRQRPITRLIGSVVIASTGYLAYRILDYSDGWPPYWQAVTLVTAFGAAVLWVLRRLGSRSVVLGSAAIVLLLGPVTTNLYTVNTAQSGTNPLSGPTSKIDGSLSLKFKAARQGFDARTLQIAFGSPPDAHLLERLKDSPEGQEWAAVTVTAQNAALYQLESGEPVGALGGWLGLDPAPTLAQFKALVTEGRIGLFIDQPELLMDQKLGKQTDAIVQWIREHYAPTTVGRETVYDFAAQ